ncbi:MAG TPA: hypothetical protein ACFYEK_06165 [Candidatus Wunengus sp. YC60]|uniref:hypothetical protein n=1 Tax=Candidatus Wunengus sp. YC60 TaxID=3367697 RepID=UPI004024D977
MSINYVSVAKQIVIGFTGSGTTTWTSGILDITIPDPTITITSHSDETNIALVAPIPTLDIMTAGGPMLIGAPSPTIEITGSVQWNELEIEVPDPVITIISTYTTGILNIRSPSVGLSFTSNDGSHVDLALTAPDPIITMTCKIIATATVAITAPVPIIDISTGVIATSRKCIVLNTDNWEVSEYDWTFNELVKFGDKYLVINSTGIYSITGDTFAGTNIDAVLETGQDDHDTLQSKRITDLWVSWKSKEDGLVSIIMDGDSDETYDYDLISTDDNNDAVKVDVGRPSPKKHISIKLQNQSGVAFTLSGMEMVISLSPKKTRGVV